MTKMMFIRPPFKGMGRYVPPHLGIATLYNYLHGKFDWIEFSLVDALADALDEEQIVKAINYSRPDILAITIKTMQVKQAKEIIERVKDIYNPLIICGGNHVSVSPQEFVRCGADYAIVGEGEEAIEKIIQHEFGHYEESLDDCVNICTKNNVERSGFEPNAYIVICNTKLFKHTASNIAKHYCWSNGVGRNYYYAHEYSHNDYSQNKHSRTSPWEDCLYYPTLCNCFNAFRTIVIWLFCGSVSDFSFICMLILRFARNICNNEKNLQKIKEGKAKKWILKLHTSFIATPASSHIMLEE